MTTGIKTNASAVAQSASARPSCIEKAVAEAIVELMMTTDFSKITVRDVVGQAGIARSSFYRYYSSVEDAVQQMEDEFFTEIERINSASLQALSLGGGPAGATSSQVQRFEYFRQKSRFILAVDGPHGDAAFRMRSERTFAEYYAKRMESQGLPADKLDLYTSFAAAGHYAMVRRWLERHEDVSPLEMAEMTNRLFYSVPTLSV